MATSGHSGAGDKAAGASYPLRQPSRWKRNLLLLLLLVLALWLAWTWRGLREEARVGTALGARLGCVCRFVSQRPLESCEGDLKVTGLQGAGRWVSLAEDAPSRTIKASVPLLASQSADFEPSRGCRLEPWQD
ncbi:hypothetical protein AB3M93_05835 [Novosphingobium panipatense]|jgi:hypothetical protein|uniref:hypothetical protein n=1 Tax=Novosphingobium TaxID=165696 RepID=UPI000CDAF7CA|nr:hypothetical protein [Novosphingobium sp. HII-3]